MDLTQILPSMGSGIFTLVAFVLALSVIVAIHEYGHYIVGRWSGIHAEVFSLGFGPVLLSRTDRHGTVWQIAALPFGGYVKFLGDADAASMESTDVASGHDARNTMPGAPLWARTLTVAAGPVFNFALSILIFSGYQMYQGMPADPLTYESEVALPPAYASDMALGDQIIRIGDIVLADDALALDSLPIADRIEYEVLRDGVDTIVEGPYPIPPRVDGLSPTSAADDAGLKIGDVITAIDGEPIFAFRQIANVITDGDGAEMVLEIWRNGETFQVTLAPRRVDLPDADGNFETRWLIGINGDLFFETLRESVGPWEALKIGTSQLYSTVTLSLSGMWNILTGAISSCNISGPVGIAQTSGSMASQGTGSFVLFIGMLSAAVGLLNLFPIPVLDGGHLVFYAYEAVTRRKPSESALRVLMTGGLTIILALMSFAMLNDLVLCP